VNITDGLGFTLEVECGVIDDDTICVRPGPVSTDALEVTAEVECGVIDDDTICVRPGPVSTDALEVTAEVECGVIDDEDISVGPSMTISVTGVELAHMSWSAFTTSPE
jgi:hypothetical protein